MPSPMSSEVRTSVHLWKESTISLLTSVYCASRLDGRTIHDHREVSPDHVTGSRSPVWARGWIQGLSDSLVRLCTGDSSMTHLVYPQAVSMESSYRCHSHSRKLYCLSGKRKKRTASVPG